MTDRAKNLSLRPERGRGRILRRLGALLVLLGAWAVAPAAPAPLPAGIVGGTLAEVGAYPWQVLLLVELDEPGLAQLCGGSIVAERWIVTAAHCLMVGEGRVAAVGKVEIRAGSNDSARGYTLYRPVRLVTHPNFSPVTFDNDIALIESEAPLSCDRCAPIGLVTPEEQPYVAPPGTLATVTGWGTTSEGAAAPERELREVELPILSNEACNDPSRYDGAITANMLCAGYDEGGKDSCHGDSGGPLVVPASDGTGRRLLAGVVSWGQGCGVPNRPGVYSRVARFSRWISGVITPGEGGGGGGGGADGWLAAALPLLLLGRRTCRSRCEAT